MIKSFDMSQISAWKIQTIQFWFKWYIMWPSNPKCYNCKQECTIYQFSKFQVSNIFVCFMENHKNVIKIMQNYSTTKKKCSKYSTKISTALKKKSIFWDCGAITSF